LSCLRNCHIEVLLSARFVHARSPSCSRSIRTSTALSGARHGIARAFHYDYEQVSIHIVSQALQNSQGEAGTLDNLLRVDAGQDGSEYRHAVQGAITLLASFSLVARDVDTSLSMHPLVHE